MEVEEPLEPLEVPADIVAPLATAAPGTPGPTVAPAGPEVAPCDDDVVIVEKPKPKPTVQSSMTVFFASVEPPARGVPCPPVLRVAKPVAANAAVQLSSQVVVPVGPPGIGSGNRLQKVLSKHKRVAAQNAKKAGKPGPAKKRKATAASIETLTAPGTS